MVYSINNAPVAQWIERLVAVQKVAGPIPAKRTAKGAYQLLDVRQESEIGAMYEFSFFDFCKKGEANTARWGREKFPSGNLSVTDIPAKRTKSLQ